jgi:hypothetical protein
MIGRPERRRARARAEGQRLRIIRLLEELGDIEPKEQCEKCGRWFDQVSSHKPHCDGPEH